MGAKNIKKQGGLDLILVSIIAVFLNFQKLVFGINVSISDITLLSIVGLLILRKKIYIPKSSVIFFITLLVSSFMASMFLSPNKFNYNLNVGSINIDYIKLFASFLYFIFGYNIVRNNYLDYIFKWFSLTVVLTGLIGIIIVVFKINLFKNFFFFYGSRYMGFMNDPNYFAVLQCSALPIIVHSKSFKTTHKAILTSIILLSVLFSASKTGVIIFSVYFFIQYIKILKTKNSRMIKSDVIIKTIVIGLIALIIFVFLRSKLELFANLNPVLYRIKNLFLDFENAISADGSNRMFIWKGAIKTIISAPLFGVGIGSYSIVRQSQGSGGFAHNTFLQITAEWGIPLSFIFFSYIMNIYRHTSNYAKRNYVRISRDVLLIFLLGSLSLSLNNARMLWLFIGINLSLTRFNKTIT